MMRERGGGGDGGRGGGPFNASENKGTLTHKQTISSFHRPPRKQAESAAMQKVHFSRAGGVECVLLSSKMAL